MIALDIFLNTIGILLILVVLAVAFLTLNRTANDRTSARGFAKAYFRGRDQHWHDTRKEIKERRSR